ncbi:MAG: tetratricopeptide repeat protein [Pseudomonadota bacterium]
MIFASGRDAESRRFSCLFTMAGLGALFLAACGSPPAAEAPPPALDSAADAPATKPADRTEKPSSAKVEQGISAIKAQDFAKAKALLSAAHAEAPKDPQAAFYLGVALEGLSDGTGAAAAYKDALALDPKLTEASVNLAALSLDAKDAAGALSVADAGLKVAPKQPDLLLNRALALEALGKKEESLKAYGAAVAAAPDNIELRIAYAELLTAAKDDAKALEQLRAVSTTEDPKLLEQLSQKFGRLHAFADCIAVLDKAIKAADSANLHVRRAVCRHDQKDDAGALSDYEAALKLDDKFAPAHYYLAKHVCPTDKKKAALHFKRAADLAGADDIGKRAAQGASKASAGKCE